MVGPADQGERGELGEHPGRAQVAGAQRAAAAVAVVLGPADDAVDRGAAEEEAEARRRRRLGDAERPRSTTAASQRPSLAPASAFARVPRASPRAHQVGGGEVASTTGQDQQVGKPVPGRKAGEPLDHLAHRAVAGEDGDVALAPCQDAIERRRHVFGTLDANDLRTSAAASALAWSARPREARKLRGLTSRQGGAGAKRRSGSAGVTPPASAISEQGRAHPDDRFLELERRRRRGIPPGWRPPWWRRPSPSAAA